MSVASLRYARAASEAAEAAGKQKAVDALAKGVEAFSAALAGSPELREALRNPQVAKERDGLLDEILGKLGAGEHATRLVKLFIDADRLAELDELATDVRRIADEGAGRLQARVQSAMKLSEAQQKRIAKALEGRLGRKVELLVDLDPALLGGLVIEVGDLTIDSSVRHQLELLRERLEAAGQ